MGQNKLSDFNIKKNLSLLFFPPKKSYFYSFDGLRATSLLLVVAFHCIFFLGYYNPKLMFNIIDIPAVFLLMNASYAVDAFFVISGFIISYLLMKEWIRNNNISIRDFFYRRALRILPAYYITLIILAISNSKNIENIWSNIFYINNFLTVPQQFMPWAWSLAIEEQFYIIFPFFLIILLKLNRFRFTVLAILLLITILIRYIMANIYNVQIPPIHPLLNLKNYILYFDTIYDKPYARFGAIVIGIMVSYIYLFTNVKETLNNNKFLRYFLLSLALILLVPFFFGLYPSVHNPIIVNKSVAYFMMVNYRYIFSLAIGYILFFTIIDKGKESLIGKFLSSPIWYPISQLTYSAYLLHPIIIMFFYSNFLNRKADHATILQIVMYGSGLIILSLIAALCLFLTIERPMMNKSSRYRHINKR